MTDSEMKKAKKCLVPWEGTPEQKMRREELWCIEMINSIIAYSYCNGFPDGYTGEKFIKLEEKLPHNYLEEFIETLGRDTVARLIEAQVADVDHIERGVFTDGEGCLYNAIVWKERRS